MRRRGVGQPVAGHAARQTGQSTVQARCVFIVSGRRVSDMNNSFPQFIDLTPVHQENFKQTSCRKFVRAVDFHNNREGQFGTNVAC
jgi:hypothetical protein